MQVPEAKRWFNFREAADYLGESVRWLKRQKERGLIAHHKFGRHVKFERADLDTYISNTRVPAERS